MQLKRKLFALSALTIALSACGGGGGSEDDDSTSVTPPTPPPPPPPYSVSISAANTVEENASLTIDVETSGGEGSESITASIREPSPDPDDEEGAGALTSPPPPDDEDVPVGDVSFERTDTGFVFHFGELSYKQADYVITIEATRGDEAKSEELAVVVNNTSGNKVLDYVTAVHETLPAQRQFIAEWLMVERLVKGVNIAGGDIDIKDLKPLYVNATSGETDNNNLLSAHVNDERLSGYADNSLTESDAFDGFLTNTSADNCESPFCFNEHFVHVKPLFDYIFERSGDVIQAPAYGNVGFDAGTGTYSIFYTAPDNGSFDEQGNWTFKPEYEYLADIIVAGHAAARTFSAAE